MPRRDLPQPAVPFVETTSYSDQNSGEQIVLYLGLVDEFTEDRMLSG